MALDDARVVGQCVDLGDGRQQVPGLLRQGLARHRQGGLAGRVVVVGVRESSARRGREDARAMRLEQLARGQITGPGCVIGQADRHVDGDDAELVGESGSQGSDVVE